MQPDSRALLQLGNVACQHGRIALYLLDGYPSLARQAVKTVAAVKPVQVRIVGTAQGSKIFKRQFALKKLKLMAMRVPPVIPVGNLFRGYATDETSFFMRVVTSIFAR